MSCMSYSKLCFMTVHSLKLKAIVIKFLLEKQNSSDVNAEEKSDDQISFQN